MSAINNLALKRDKIAIERYTYDLPQERIAQYPNEHRDSSKLLVYKNFEISNTVFNNIGSHIPANSVIVYNNTKVIHARLGFFKETGAKIEIFCLSPYIPVEYTQAFEAREQVSWCCMVGNQKKWKEGPLKLSFGKNGKKHTLRAEKKGMDNKGNTVIHFSWDGALSFAEILQEIGTIPIPPYLNRDSERVDSQRYQTVYSLAKGSVAAPTAGLHFTEALLAKLQSSGVAIKEITLHVGAGTFQPVKSSNAREHTMHAEQINVSASFLEYCMNKDRKVIATGTTSLRTLESLYWLGVKILRNLEPDVLHQWEWEELPSAYSLKESFEAILNYISKNDLDYYQASTEIMIVPGYNFKVVDILITNFHQPNSTLLLLIAAFTGNDWQKIYAYALENEFRFLSYGDSSILFRHPRLEQ